VTSDVPQVDLRSMFEEFASRLEQGQSKLESRFDRLDERIELFDERIGRLEAAIDQQGLELASLQSRFEILQRDNEIREIAFGFPATRGSIDRHAALRRAEYGLYANSGRGDSSPVAASPGRPRPLSSQTEAAQSGFSYDPSVRKLATPRYG
jgi:uncharacterized protein YdcH (DUF465 family)